MSKYSAQFPGDVDPVHPGWYQTQVACFGTFEKLGMYYNYWNGSDWAGVIFGNPIRVSKSVLDYEMLSNRDCNLNGEFYWRGLSSKP